MRFFTLFLVLLITAPAYAQGYRVVASYPHDSGAFTQGLFYLSGTLYESTGGEGRSDIREVRLEDGKVIRRVPLPPQYFGEGIVLWKGEILNITWLHGIGFRWDLRNFKPKASFRYQGEGWGLTQDGSHIIMSDGTPELRVIDPATFRELSRVRVSDQGRPVSRLNELEYVKGEIWANVWMTPRIARIDPATGEVRGWIDLRGLVEAQGIDDPDAVLNGIAYDAKDDRVFVTGKNWPRLYEIKVE
ncbi:glutaminyl-peptide cyclotransferase [Rhizorhapis suberifaciens]|uniref:Glutaminyl-peptide cyclotransferase n=1 Tax=Rhizorhapis suberifaciens TaxID=13656 RepID=A0A840HU34_9SPHN|nr:glutaminyl-peptide cyclotransferase [Rhizorhapis suberifaciens]MBB4640994.1 glutaminyl-peptide cyclotransferase [Rhizorhapis suberifaciens]